MIQIILENEKYYLKSELTAKPEYLCKKNALTQHYIEEIAQWAYERIESEEAFRKWESKTSIY